MDPSNEVMQKLAKLNIEPHAPVTTSAQITAANASHLPIRSHTRTPVQTPAQDTVANGSRGRLPIRSYTPPPRSRLPPRGLPHAYSPVYAPVSPGYHFSYANQTPVKPPPIDEDKLAEIITAGPGGAGLTEFLSYDSRPEGLKMLEVLSRRHTHTSSSPVPGYRATFQASTTRSQPPPLKIPKTPKLTHVYPRSPLEYVSRTRQIADASAKISKLRNKPNKRTASSISDAQKKKVMGELYDSHMRWLKERRGKRGPIVPGPSRENVRKRMLKLKREGASLGQLSVI